MAARKARAKKEPAGRSRAREDKAGSRNTALRPGASARISERILAAARAEFLAEGYAGASTNAILKRVGGSKATLFRYFPTKALLFEAVVERFCIAELARLGDGLARGKPQTALRQFARRTVSFAMRPRFLFLLQTVIAESRRFPALAAIARRSGPVRFRKQLADAMASWREKGLIETEAPDADARRLTDLLLNAPVLRALIAGKPLSAREIRTLADAAVDDFLARASPR